MPPLDTDDLKAASIAETVRLEASRRIVLPRFLRRPMRMLSRLDWSLPRFVGLKALALLILATGTAGMIAGGHATNVASAVTAWAGFGIENVKITGQSETSEVDVLNAINFNSYPSLLTLDIEAARARIEALPWVRSAALKKLFPDTLEVAVVEREPFALWQFDGQIALIDDTGRVIVDRVGERYANLPRVVGKGASERVTEYLDMIAPFPEIAKRARAGVLVSETRWTVVLDSGMQLLLPGDDPAGALAAVVALDQAQSVLSREIAALDLRQSGQTIVRLTDAGVVARKAALEEREKMARRGRTNT